MTVCAKKEKVGKFFVNTFQTRNTTHAEVVFARNTVHTTGECANREEAFGLACRWIERHSD